MIYIKQYTDQGSTVAEYSVAKEAEKVLNESRHNGGYVFAESTKEILHSKVPLVDGETYTVIPAIAGG